MKKSSRLFRGFGLSSIIFLIVACSPLRASKPEPRTLALPEADGGTGFSLSGDAPSGVYRGGLLFFSPDVKPQQIATLLKATRETNEKYLTLNRYFRNFQEKEIAPAMAALEAKRVEFNSAKAQADEKSAPIQEEKSAAWFEDELRDLKSRFVDFDPTRSREIFEAYCEAKIIDLATRPFLAKYAFKKRPTPSALCESYYKGRFFDGDDCSQDGQERSFYRCVWTKGVRKTRFGERLQIKVSNTASGAQTSTVVDLADFAQMPIVRNAFALEDVPFCTSAGLMRPKILSGIRFKVLARGKILGGLQCGTNDQRFEISYGMGEWDKDLATSTPGYLIDAVENKLGSNQLPLTFQWMAPETATSHPELAAGVFSIVSKIATFQSELPGCSNGFSSPNDIFFNQARMTANLSSADKCMSPLPAPENLPNVFVVDERLESQKRALDALERDFAAMKGQACPVEPSCEGVASGHARCDFLNAQVRKAAAAEATGVASILVTDFALSFERASPNASTVVVWMNNAAVGVGCLGEAEQGACTKTPLSLELSSAIAAQAELSPSQELVVRMKIDTKKMAAAGVPDSVVRQFLPFQDKELELNARRNSFGQAVPYLSGKAFIRQDNTGSGVLAEGSVSYLIENSFDRALGQFCSVH